MKQFFNETQSSEINGLTVENHLDRIAIYGAGEITLDKDGLKAALKLKQIIDAACEELQRREKAGSLPDAITCRQLGRIINPLAPKS